MSTTIGAVIRQRNAYRALLERLLKGRKLDKAARRRLREALENS